MKKKYNKIKLRYGENPKQKAHLISNNNKSIFDFQISGKKISYNNIIDIDSGLKCLSEFTEPTSVIVKYTNPCGVASINRLIELLSNHIIVIQRAHLRVNFLNRKVIKLSE